MQRSLFSAVSGLRTEQTQMDVIGNNIANVNTTAFKSQRATFKQTFAQVLSAASRPTPTQGGQNPTDVGLGVQLGSIDTVFTQGNLQTTGITTDLAVQGNDFFVVANGGNTSYTRAGNFQIDADGSLVSPTNGAIVQGTMAVNGTLTGGLTNIKLPTNQSTAAKATTKATLSGNFNAAAATITAVDPTNPTTAELTNPQNAGSVVQTTLNVYDSLGNTHSLAIDAWKSGPNTWGFKVDPSGIGYDSTKPYSFGPGAQSSPAGPTTPWQFTFNSDGTVNKTASNIPTISFTPLGNGSPLSLTLDPGSGATAVTSFAGGSSAILSGQDGYTAGTLTKITISPDGTIQGAFSNGTNLTLAQVALASFNNPEGLESVGDNMYAVSSNSGTPLVGYSGKNTSSTIASGALEMSNVDLAQEFTNMIITQRGFEANGKMITTSDQMLQTLVNMRQ